MAIAAFASSKRANVSPTNSVLRLQVEDVDCSGSDFAVAPEDGQVIVAIGATGKALGADETKHIVASNATDTVSVDGAGLAIVWSGGAQRVDQQALKNARVPVIRGPARIKTKLFASDDVAAIPSANNWVVGAQVGAKKIAVALQGSASRLALYPMGTDVSGWALGFVSKIVSDTVASAEIEVQLYDKPVLVNRTAA